MGTLWVTYVNDTMAKCVLDYFLNKVEDAEIKPVIGLALSICEQHIQALTEIFVAESFPIPKGFTEEDVNLNAKRLYSDSFFLYYIKNMSKIGISTYSAVYTMATRGDIRSFFGESMMQTKELD